MSWQFVREFTLSDDWQYSEPIEGRYFRLQPISPPAQARMTVAQASTAVSVELFDARKLISPVAHVLDFQPPPFWEGRRIALRKNPLAPPWRVRLEVSSLTGPSPSPTPTPPGSQPRLIRELLTIETDAQTQFTLQLAATVPELSELYLNGVKATYGQEYALNGSQLTWLMPLPLQPGDEFELLYYGQPTAQSQGNLNRELLTIALEGQTQFTLQLTPIAPELSELYLNGVKATYGQEYALNGSQLTWLMPLPLQPGDELEIYYRA